MLTGWCISRHLRALARNLAGTSGGSTLLGVAAHKVSRGVELDAPLDVAVLLRGVGLALLGGLLAGAAGALRAARLRPADALRALE